MTAVEIADLVVRYGEVTAVDGVTFRADEGAVTAVLGPNGAGKTSTIESLEGYRRFEGTATVAGLDPRTDKKQLNRIIGVMLQEGGVYPGMTPGEALELFAAYYDDPVPGLLETLGLESAANTPWRRLSGGEKQRLSLALALVGRPKVAFLDEPTAGVDPAGRIVIRNVISQLRDDGTCVLLTTHELDEAARLADHVVIMDRGRVVAAGAPRDLMGQSHEIRFGAPPGIDVAALGAHLGGQVVEEQPGEYRVDCEPTPQAVAALTGWLAERSLRLADLRAGRQSLEDLFLKLTGDRE